MSEGMAKLIAFAKEGGPRVVGLDIAAIVPAMRAQDAKFVEDMIAPARFDFLAHLERQRQFSFRTFGPGARTKGVVDHIRKELIEVEAAPHDLSEWIDIILLACDGAWRAGHAPEAVAAALGATLARNEARTWPDWRTADPDKAIEHNRDGER